VKRPGLPTGVVASLALHGALFTALWRAPPPRRTETVQIEVVETAPPPKPPPAPPVSAPERPRLEPPKVARALPADAPEAKAPEPEAPPPPNEPPPPGAPPPAQAPVKLGLSLSSTTAAGGVAAPVGNTLYGKLPTVAPAPDTVKPYAAEKYVAPTQVTALPRPISLEVPSSEYPPEALAQGIEGTVYLRLLIDAAGGIAEITVVEDPGHGFAEAAVRIARRYFKFAPALRGGEPVATVLTRVPVRFELP
jgi:protein TonB